MSAERQQVLAITGDDQVGLCATAAAMT